MDLKKEEKQRDEFRKILYELAKDQEKLQDASYRVGIYKRLEALYDAPSSDKVFRHFYSDIFIVISDIQQKPELGDINVLGQNLEQIRRGYQAINSTDGQRCIDISDSIKKLCDHVSLEIARSSCTMKAERKVLSQDSIAEVQRKVKEVSVNCDRIKTELKDTNEKLENSQKEYITILGIFASIVLAFTGGIAFSTSVLNNIAKASVYRTLVVSIIIGFVLINTLFGLFFT